MEAAVLQELAERACAAAGVLPLPGAQPEELLAALRAADEDGQDGEDEQQLLATSPQESVRGAPVPSTKRKSERRREKRREQRAIATGQKAGLVPIQDNTPVCEDTRSCFLSPDRNRRMQQPISPDKFEYSPSCQTRRSYVPSMKPDKPCLMDVRRGAETTPAERGAETIPVEVPVMHHVEPSTPLQPELQLPNWLPKEDCASWGGSTAGVAGHVSTSCASGVSSPLPLHPEQYRLDDDSSTISLEDMYDFARLIPTPSRGSRSLVTDAVVQSGIHDIEAYKQIERYAVQLHGQRQQCTRLKSKTNRLRWELSFRNRRLKSASKARHQVEAKLAEVTDQLRQEREQRQAQDVQLALRQWQLTDREQQLAIERNRVQELVCSLTKASYRPPISLDVEAAVSYVFAEDRDEPEKAIELSIKEEARSQAVEAASLVTNREAVARQKLSARQRLRQRLKFRRWRRQVKRIGATSHKISR